MYWTLFYSLIDDRRTDFDFVINLLRHYLIPQLHVRSRCPLKTLKVCSRCSVQFTNDTWLQSNIDCSSERWAVTEQGTAGAIASVASAYELRFNAVAVI